jgi:hypothetical protein
MLIEVGLGDADSLFEVVIGQVRMEHLIPSGPQISRL